MTQRKCFHIQAADGTLVEIGHRRRPDAEQACRTWNEQSGWARKYHRPYKIVEH